MLRVLIVLITLLWSSAFVLAQSGPIPPSYFGEQPSAITTITWPKLTLGAIRLWDACDSNSNGGSCGTYDGTYYAKWNNVETSNGGTGCTTGYVFTYLDNMAAHVATENGPSQIYTFGYVPGWANSSAGVAVPPSDLTSAGSPSFNNFATCLAARYAGTINYFELWNEPYISATWSGTAQQMVYMAKGAYAAIHAANANAVVLSPNSSGAIWSDATGSYQTYLQEFLADGGGPYFDVLALHLYPADTAPQPPEYLANMVAYNQYALAAHSLSTVPIWGTEWSCTANQSGNCITNSGQTYLAVYYILGWPLGISRMLHYQYDNGGAWSQLTGNNQGLNAAGAAYRAVETWLLGGTWTSAPARQVGTNDIRNSTMTGAVAGTGSTCSTMTNGTPPTNMGVYANDSAHGVYWQIVSASGGYIDLRICGTPTAGANGATQFYFESASHVAATLGTFLTFSFNLSLKAGSFTNVTPSFQWNETNSGGGYLGTDANRYVYPFSDSSLAVSSQKYWTYTTEITNSLAAYVQPLLSVNYTVGNAFDITLRIASPSIDNGTTWQGAITRSNGAQSIIAWDVSGSASFTTTSACGGSNCAYWRDIFGSLHPVSGSSVLLSNSPIILDAVAQPVRFN